MTLSVVIPTWNEASSISVAVSKALAINRVTQVIVSDGGSVDETCALAYAAGARVMSGARGRGSQLRLGAAACAGEVIVLLHADTWLHPAAGDAIERAFRPSGVKRPVVAGAFTKRFRDAPSIMRGARWRSWLFFQFTGYAFGDQAIFVRREVLEQIGGVPPVPLMEEFELFRRLRSVGRMVLLQPSVTTSARRFRQHGIVKTYGRMMRVLWLYRRGVSPDELAKIYDGRGSKQGDLQP